MVYVYFHLSNTDKTKLWYLVYYIIAAWGASLVPCMFHCNNIAKVQHALHVGLGTTEGCCIKWMKNTLLATSIYIILKVE